MTSATTVSAPRGGPVAQRLFLALWPPPVLARRWHQLAGQWLGEGVRRSVAADLHVTLVFLGEVNGAQRRVLERALRQVWLPPVRLRFERLECWQGGRICCLTAAPTPDLLRLHRELLAIVRRCGIAADARALRPHVTLARRVTVRQAPRERALPGACWLFADALCLASSRVAGAIPRYRVLQRWALVGRRQ